MYAALDFISDRSPITIDERNASVGVQQEIHLNISRFGVIGWLRPSGMNGSEMKRSSSSNHFVGSAISGSSRTPWVYLANAHPVAVKPKFSR